MIIFIDDLATQGVTAAELNNSEPNDQRRRRVEQAHLDRIRNTRTVLPLSATESI